MTENTTQTSEQPKPEAPKLTLSQYFQKTNLPKEALKPVTDKVDEYLALVKRSNGLVASINAAKAQDPSNVEYLDSLWKANASDDPELASIEEQFDLIAEQYESLLKQLREGAKKFIPEQLSEEATKDARKSVNEMAPTISAAKTAAASMFAIPESMLKALSIEFPAGGLVTLLPEAESLKGSGRGRKAASAGEKGPYMTRVGDVLIDGKSTQINGKGKFDYAADQLSELFGKSIHPGNEVTPRMLEEAFFEAMGKPFRSITGKDIPDTFSFEFEHITKRQNPNDDSFTDVPQKVKLTVIKAESKSAETATPTESPAPEKQPEAKATETPAPAKKAAAPAKK